MNSERKIMDQGFVQEFNAIAEDIVLGKGAEITGRNPGISLAGQSCKDEKAA